MLTLYLASMASGAPISITTKEATTMLPTLSYDIATISVTNSTLDNHDRNKSTVRLLELLTSSYVTGEVTPTKISDQQNSTTPYETTAIESVTSRQDHDYEHLQSRNSHTGKVTEFSQYTTTNTAVITETNTKFEGTEIHENETIFEYGAKQLKTSTSTTMTTELLSERNSEILWLSTRSEPESESMSFDVTEQYSNTMPGESVHSLGNNQDSSDSSTDATSVVDVIKTEGQLITTIKTGYTIDDVQQSDIISATSTNTNSISSVDINSIVTYNPSESHIETTSPLQQRTGRSISLEIDITGTTLDETESTNYDDMGHSITERSTDASYITTPFDFDSETNTNAYYFTEETSAISNEDSRKKIVRGNSLSAQLCDLQRFDLFDLCIVSLNVKYKAENAFNYYVSIQVICYSYFILFI